MQSYSEGGKSAYDFLVFESLKYSSKPTLQPGVQCLRQPMSSSTKYGAQAKTGQLELHSRLPLSNSVTTVHVTQKNHRLYQKSIHSLSLNCYQVFLPWPDFLRKDLLQWRHCVYVLQNQFIFECHYLGRINVLLVQTCCYIQKSREIQLAWGCRLWRGTQ